MGQHYRTGLMVGRFDGYHFGHVHAIFQAAQVCEEVCVGVTDEESALFDLETRQEMLRHCKFVHRVLPSTPFPVTPQVLDAHNCDVYLHGVGGRIDGTNTLRKAGRLVECVRTPGISSTNLMGRLLKCPGNSDCKDVVYLRHLFEKIRPPKPDGPKLNSAIVIVADIASGWDFITLQHAEFISRLHDAHPHRCIIVCVPSNDTGVYNSLERAIILSSLQHVDWVGIGTECLFGGLRIDSKVQGTPVCMPHPSNGKLCKRASEYKHAKQIRADFWDSGVYHTILRGQFQTLINILQSTVIATTDMLIFDIDETIFNNLMYHEPDLYAFGDYENGLNPIIGDFVLDMFSFLHNTGIQYSFITGRRQFWTSVTKKNLRMLGMDRHAFLFLCPDDFVGSVASFKEECRRKIVKAGYTIRMCIGDQVTDMQGDCVGMPYLLFNPFYSTT